MPRRSSFGRTPDGAAIDAFTIANAHGVEVSLITYGAILRTIHVPDRYGRFADVALGFDDLDGYLTRSRYLGAIVGRYANRIANACLTIDGRVHRLARNNGRNHLHGGVRGFDKAVWKAEPFASGGGDGVRLCYTSADGEEGYPGQLDVIVTYTLTPDDDLVVDYAATTDRATHVNPTQHSYFNLAGEGCGDVLSHVVTIDADAFTAVDDEQIPTGALTPVEGTPFDFRRGHAIGERIDAGDPRLQLAGGYDHNYVLNADGARARRAVRVVEPRSGRTLDLSTTEPGVQFYSGNRLGIEGGKHGHRYAPRSGFCLETQHFPDSPNHPDFPSTLLRPGDTFRSQTVFTFGVISPHSSSPESSSGG